MRPALLLALLVAGCWRQTTYLVPSATVERVRGRPADDERVAVAAMRVDDWRDVWVAADKMKLPPPQAPSPEMRRVRAKAIDPRRTVGIVLLGTASAFASLGGMFVAFDAVSGTDFPLFSFGIGVPLLTFALAHAIVGTILVAVGVAHPAEVSPHRAGWTYWGAQ